MYRNGNTPKYLNVELELVRNRRTSGLHEKFEIMSVARLDSPWISYFEISWKNVMSSKNLKIDLAKISPINARFNSKILQKSTSIPKFDDF